MDTKDSMDLFSALAGRWETHGGDWGPDAAEVLVHCADQLRDLIGEVMSEAASRDLDRAELNPHEWCRRCGGPNVIWSCQSPLWNYVMRGNDINSTEPLYRDLVCMACFILCAAEAGLPAKGWRLTLVPEPEGLIYETPSGRAWDEEKFLWVSP